MANNLGPGVSRVLDPAGTGYSEVIWQKGRPPLDAELNLLQELASGAVRVANLRGTPSGWLLHETNTLVDYQTNSTWSNWFRFGKQRTGELQSFAWANVNGWLIPVGGTRTGTPPGSPNDTDTTNIIALDPPPTNSGDTRVDFVFLEVWLARVQPNPAVTNKPSASAIWRYGNVEGGFSFLADDLKDPTIGQETTQRVQVQYRIRVVKGLVGFTSYPEGFDPAVVKARGAATADTSFTFTNMRQTLDDPGLWRAGDGTSNALGTVDGYSYAVPICVVFRRNAVTWQGEPAQNLNGGFNRNPTAVDRTGIKTFSTVPTLSAVLTDSATSLTLTSASNIPMPVTPATPVYIQIGDEILTYASITGTTVSGLVRGPAVAGTRAERHPAGATIRVLSGRPDALYADQIATTDILDLRHAVNPNGFNYETLLKTSVMKLLRGELRAGWKRTGAGPQGVFLNYQDKIASGSVSLGVTKLDAPDNIRQVFSDAGMTQKIYVPIEPNAASLPAAIGVSWSLSLSVNHTTRSVAGQFNPTDVLQIPVAQLKSGLPGGDSDQVRWLNDVAGQVEIRIDGETNPLPPTAFSVTPSNPGPTDNLTITLNASFPSAVTRQLWLTLHVMYGPGRGTSRRPDAVHTVEYLSPSSELVVQQPKAAPLGSFPTRVAPLALWAKYQGTALTPFQPVLTETYADLGSKTLVLNPLRRVDMPDKFFTIDGTAANPVTSPYASGTQGSTVGTTVLTDTSVNFITLGAVAGNALVLTTGPQTGRYTVQSVTATTLTLDRTVPTSGGPTTSWQLFLAQGLMPLLKKDNATAKWGTPDPLELFSGTSDPALTTKNLYVQIPRYLVPGWGEYRLPLLWQDQGVFSEGVNYAFLTGKGAGPYSTTTTNYIPYSNGALSFALFSTVQLQFAPPLLSPTVYNTKYTVPVTYAGIRKFTETTPGYQRSGLELPPFYGIARLWAVYEANDYATNGSAYNASTRVALGTGAKNLLRQNMPEPLFWVTADEDGDSTFVLNSAALDLSKSTNFPISNFNDPDTHFVIEASIFGFDRDAFTGDECRIVLTRVGATGFMRSEAADLVLRSNNLNVQITGPVQILTGPPTSSDQVLVNFSRTPYQGDVWGSQTVQQDLPYSPGTLTTATAFLLGSTQLDLPSLTRPNQKALEVLAATSFATTLGTGRLSGRNYGDLRPENVGYEDYTTWPPIGSLVPRPKTQFGALTGADVDDIGSEFLGCTERLPLGALFRDKDFKGQRFYDQAKLPLVFFGNVSNHNTWRGFALGTTLEAQEVRELHTATAGTPEPGMLLVHVDGEQGNYSLLTNFRVTRGGSVFTASGPYPGAEVFNHFGITQTYAAFPRTLALAVTAYLVRNTVTNVGLTEVSAGDELMLLVLTTVIGPLNAAANMMTGLGTNGANESYAAADLYRIEGHPLVRDHNRTDLDPSTIQLVPFFRP